MGVMGPLCDPVGAVPDLELVDVGRAHSFVAISHGYPFRTVRWHFHPEYEIHLIVETSGRAFVGDFIGTFAPGNLVMTGPDLPHNWISDSAVGEVARRGQYVQFSASFIDNCLAVFPELGSIRALLADSRRGIEFAAETGAAAEPILTELLLAEGPRRIELLMRLFVLLQADHRRRLLASPGYEATPSDYMAEPINHVLAHIKRNLTAPLREGELATLCGCSRSAFSRRFRKHVGMSFVQYINRLRIHRACGLLSRDASARITDVCYQSGFNNLSNFNRQFLSQKNVTPTQFRDSHVAQAARPARVAIAGNAQDQHRCA